jgi:hypothetical protein
MNLDRPLYDLRVPIDISSALFEAERARMRAEPYTDKRYPSLKVDRWLISRDYGPYVQQLMRKLDIRAKPRFYFQQPYYFLPEHVDNDTTCSVNIVLTPNPAPVTVEGVDYTYTQAVLDTTKRHSVQNGPEERILLKFSIFDVSYEDMCKHLESYSANLHI